MTGVATRLVSNLQARRNANNHSILGIQGDPGDGKSYCAISLGRNIDPEFGMDNIFYGRTELFEVVAPAPKGGVFILDEGTNAAMNRHWQDADQIELMQIFNTIRQRRHTIFWCQPNVQRLDVVLREDLLTHKVNCVQRGSARVRTKKRDRDGEQAGWVTWPGFLGWPNLDDHPVFGKKYMDDKEDAYFASLRNFKAKRLMRKKKKEEVLADNEEMLRERQAYT